MIEIRSGGMYVARTKSRSDFFLTDLPSGFAAPGKQAGGLFSARTGRQALGLWLPKGRQANLQGGLRRGDASPPCGRPYGSSRANTSVTAALTETEPDWITVAAASSAAISMPYALYDRKLDT